MQEYIEISNSQVRDGLRDMLRDAEPEEDLDNLLINERFFAVENILWVIEIAKIAPDKPEWFPRGKWATTQNLQRKCTEAISTLFREIGEEKDV